MLAIFDRFAINVTKSDAKTGSHQGRCDDDIAYLRTKPYIRRQLDRLCADAVAAELKEYGAWDADELSDHEANLNRILWIACGDICEGRAA